MNYTIELEGDELEWHDFLTTLHNLPVFKTYANGPGKLLWEMAAALTGDEDHIAEMQTSVEQWRDVIRDCEAQLREERAKLNAALSGKMQTILFQFGNDTQVSRGSKTIGTASLPHYIHEMVSLPGVNIVPKPATYLIHIPQKSIWVTEHRAKDGQPMGTVVAAIHEHETLGCILFALFYTGKISPTQISIPTLEKIKEYSAANSWHALWVDLDQMLTSTTPGRSYQTVFPKLKAWLEPKPLTLGRNDLVVQYKQDSAIVFQVGKLEGKPVAAGVNVDDGFKADDSRFCQFLDMVIQDMRKFDFPVIDVRLINSKETSNDSQTATGQREDCQPPDATAPGA